MTVETKNLPAVTQTGEPWEPKTLEVLTDYPEAKFNLLLPTVQVRQVNPFLVPDIEVVQLKESDIYHDSQMAEGQFAPTANGLGKLADVAGITVLDSRRMDNGKDPDVVEWRVEIEMVTPSGRPRRAMGTKRIDLHQFAETTNRQGDKPSKARLDKAREHLVANAETKALNRAIRGVLSLHGAYPKAALLKPFAVLRYVPDMSHPKVQELFLKQLAPTATALFGPTNGEPKQLTGGGNVEVAPEAPEEDPAPARDDVDADGVVVEEADWGAPAAAEQQTLEDAATDEPPMHRLLIELAERAEASNSKGNPTDTQRAQLKEATKGIGNDAAAAVMRELWGLKTPGELTRAQADAILDAAEVKREKSFATTWREAAMSLKDGAA